MADETISKLFLDATQVINTLATLTKAFEGYSKVLGEFTQKAQTYNKAESAISKSAEQVAEALGKQEKAAEDALAALNSLQGKGLPDFAKATPAQIARVNSAIVTFQNTAAKSGLTLNELNGIVNNLGGQYTGMAAKVAAAGNRYVAAVGAMQTANKGLNVALSLASIGKAFAIQQAITLLRSFVSALGDSVEEARKFELQIAAVLTISKELQTEGLDNTAAAVRRLAVEFGQPLGDVAKGLYDTISNQVGDAGESFSFLTDALRFSRAALTSTTTSVDLLSGVLNSYGLKAASATRVSDILFKTIDVGRVTADDLANTFGRVLPLASELGISLEEVSAQLATLTIQGLSTDESLTQISNVMLKLLKPNEELKQLLRDLGFTSVQAGIAAFGYQGLLQKLLDTTNGSTEATGDLFNQVRALKGVLGITGDQADLYAKSLNAIQNASIGATKAASDLISKSPAAQFTKQFEAFKSTFTDEFGRQIIAITVDLIDSFGGAEKSAIALANTLTGIVKILETIVKPVAVFLGYFNTGLNALSGNLRERNREINDLINTLNRARDEAIKNEIQANASTVQNRKNSINLSLSVTEQYFARLQQLYDADVKKATSQQEKITASYKNQISDRLNAVQDLADKLQQIQDQSLKKQKDAAKDTLDLDFKINQGKFDRSLVGKSDPQQANSLIERSNKLLAAAKQALAKGNEEFSGKLFNAAVDAAEKAANTTGQRARGEAQLNKLLQEQKVHEADIIKLEQKKAEIAGQEQVKLAQQEQTLRGQITDFNEIQAQLSKGKGELTEAQLGDFQKKAKAAAAAIEKTLGSISVNKLVDFDISRITKPFISPTNGKPVKLDLAVEDSIAQLQRTLSNTVLTIRADIVANTKTITGKDITKLGGLQGTQAAGADAVKQLNTSIENTENDIARLSGETTVALTTIELKAKAAAEAFAALRKEAVSGIPFKFENSRAAIQKPIDDLLVELEGSRKRIQAALQNGNLGGLQAEQNQLSNISKRLNDPLAAFAKADLTRVKTAVSTLATELAEAAKDTLDLNKALQQADKNFKLQKAMEDLRTGVDEVTGVSTILESSLKGVGPAAEQGSTEAIKSISGIGTSSEQQVSKVQILINKLKELNALQAGGGGGAAAAPAAFSKGGPVGYFADGGPVGTDTIPAWLTKGEYIMDDVHAAQYRTELRSMSKGEFGTGNLGSTFNNSVGDVHVHIDGSTQKIDGRVIAEEVQRQIRLRTIRGF